MRPLARSLCLAPLVLLLFSPAPLEAAAVRIGVMGDSISAGAGSNWVGQLSKAFPSAITFQNKAQGGATTDSIISGGQLATMTGLAKNGQVDISVLIIGGNNATQGALSIYSSGSPTAFINNYVNDVKLIIDTIATANPGVKQVFGNMPDVTKTELVQEEAAKMGITPAQLQILSDAIGEADRQANAYALSKGIPVLDMYGASDLILTQSAFPLGGATFTTPFASDGFHPAVWVQGLLGNMVTTALNLQYDMNLPQLSDQQIAKNAGKVPNSATTYYDVTPFILLVPEPSTLSLVGMGALGLALACLRRRAA